MAIYLTDHVTQNVTRKREQILAYNFIQLHSLYIYVYIIYKLHSKSPERRANLNMAQTATMELSYMRSAIKPDFAPVNDMTHATFRDTTATTTTTAAVDEQVLEPALSFPMGADGRAADHMSHGRAIIIIATLAGVNFLSSISTGFLTVGLPSMAGEIGLPEYLLSW